MKKRKIYIRRKKMVKVTYESIVISFSLTLLMIIMNSIGGLFIKLNYYASIFAVLLVGLILGNIMFHHREIFYKAKKTRPQVKVVKSKAVKTMNQPKVRKKIS